MYYITLHPKNLAPLLIAVVFHREFALDLFREAGSDYGFHNHWPASDSEVP